MKASSTEVVDLLHVRRVAERIDSSSIAARLVPKTFTIPEVRHVYGLLDGKPAPGKRITASKPAHV